MDQTSAADAQDPVDFDWTEDVSTFGDRLARAREYSGMTQAQVARRLGVRHSTVANWESDRSEPRANRVQMLAGLLNVSVVWLMSGEGDGGPVEADAAGAMPADLRAVLDELRDLRLAQTRLAERTGLLEKRLRDLLTTR